MSDENHRTAADARRVTRRRREERTDAVIDLPFNERADVECPSCGESFEKLVAVGDPAAYSPTFGRCSNWECDAFLKFRHDGSQETVSDDPQPAQIGLTQFTGGESHGD